MSMRQSKQKQPKREDKRVKYEPRLEEDVFDRTSLLLITRLRRKKFFDSVDYCVAKGKEANVYRATTTDGKFIAVKMYRLHATSFVHMQNYIQGDRRFEKAPHSSFGIIYTWTKKEFKNLSLMHSWGIKVPKPIAFLSNILVMEFLGENGVPFSTLAETGSADPNGDYATLDGYIELLWKNGLVHGDISEYNVMMTDNGPYLIDCGQAVLTSHPRAVEFYERDKANLLKYFSKYPEFVKKENPE